MPITAIFQLWGTNPKENNMKKKKKQDLCTEMFIKCDYK